MTIWEAVRVALSGLRSNKLRSALTCLGVIIGVGAVIAMIAMGQGASADVQERIQSMGTNLLIVWPGQARQGRVWGGVGSQDSLSSDDGVAIAKECKSVSKSAPVVQGQEQIKAGNAYVGVGIPRLNVRLAQRAELRGGARSLLQLDGEPDQPEGGGHRRHHPEQPVPQLRSHRQEDPGPQHALPGDWSAEAQRGQRLA